MGVTVKGFRSSGCNLENKPLPKSLESLTDKNGACYKDLHILIESCDFEGDISVVQKWFQDIIDETTTGAPGSKVPDTTVEDRMKSFLQTVIRDLNVKTVELTDDLLGCFVGQLMDIHKNDSNIISKLSKMTKQIIIIIENLNENSAESARPKLFAPGQLAPSK